MVLRVPLLRGVTTKDEPVAKIVTNTEPQLIKPLNINDLLFKFDAADVRY